tara:strand:+ start:880 stop:2445 length:1566 start_codon:yes stop_codon:yes gene_type:complete
MKSKFSLWKGSTYDGIVIAFLGWLYGTSIITFDALSWLLIIIGLILFILPIIFNYKNVINNLKSKRTQLGANTITIIILVFVIVGLLDYLSIRNSWRVDTTSKKEFSLSEQTISIIKNLDREVDLTAFVSEVEMSQMEDRLIEYSHYSGKFHYEIVDPIKDPDKVREFFGPDQQYLDLPSIIITTDNKREEVKSILEEDISNALIKVTRDQKRKIYFTQGHGEKSIFPDQAGISTNELIKTELINQYFEVDALNLFQKDKVPEDTDVLIISGPIKKFANNEINSIKNFLSSGGNIFLMIDPESQSGLKPILQDWNISVNDDLVLETNSSFVLTSTGLNRQSSVSAAPSAAEYGDHMITKNFRYATTFVQASSILKLNENEDKIKTTSLVFTSPNSWGETNLSLLFDEQIAEQDESDFSGPTTLAMAIEKNDSLKTRMVVVGDSDFASDVYVSQAPGNMDFFLNIVSWLAEEEDLIAVRPKEPENRTISLTMKQQNLVLFFLIILLPLVSVRIGIHIYMRRS